VEGDSRHGKLSEGEGDGRAKDRMSGAATFAKDGELAGTLPSTEFEENFEMI